MGPRFRGDDGGRRSLTEVLVGMMEGFERVRVLVGYGDGGLGPRFRGDDGGWLG